MTEADNGEQRYVLVFAFPIGTPTEKIFEDAQRVIKNLYEGIEIYDSEYSVDNAGSMLGVWGTGLERPQKAFESLSARDKETRKLAADILIYNEPSGSRNSLAFLNAVSF